MGGPGYARVGGVTVMEDGPALGSLHEGMLQLRELPGMSGLGEIRRLAPGEPAERFPVLRSDLAGLWAGGVGRVDGRMLRDALRSRVGRVVAGATRESDTGFDHRVTVGGVRQIVDDALAVAPGLEGGTVAEIRVGFRPLTRDGLPLLGGSDGVAGLVPPPTSTSRAAVAVRQPRACRGGAAAEARLRRRCSSPRRRPAPRCRRPVHLQPVLVQQRDPAPRVRAGGRGLARATRQWCARAEGLRGCAFPPARSVSMKRPAPFRIYVDHPH